MWGPKHGIPWTFIGIALFIIINISIIIINNIIIIIHVFVFVRSVPHVMIFHSLICRM
jgi:hypothetical protein